ncbi:hypothetical protein Tco_0038188 [Tanacetum coccineum]
MSINVSLRQDFLGMIDPDTKFFIMLWGIITSSNVDFAELMWEEFVQAIQTFLTDKANLGSPTKKGRKERPYVIPYCRFTKLIICHLGRTHNIHQRSTSPFHLAEEDFRLGNLKFVPKGKVDEVFGMPIPNELISNNIRNAPYYNAYLEMVAKHDRRGHPTTPSIEGKVKPLSFEEEGCQSLLALHTPKRRCYRIPIRYSKGGLRLLKRHQLDPLHNHRMTLPPIVRDSPSSADAETGAGSDKTNSGGDTEAGSDPSKTLESRPPPEQVFMDEDQAGPDPGESRVALAGPNPEPMQDEFMANVYPNVHESLKFPADEHVILEDPISSFGTLSLMKNLDDAYNIGDQFLNDKSIEDEPGKLNVEAEVVSMVIVLIYQASSSVPPLTTPVIDLSPPKHVPSTTQAPIVTAIIKSKTLDNTTQNLGYRVFTLELRDLPHKINETVCEAVKEVVHVALQAPLRDRFRELPEADMKEILHQRMFASGTYKSLPEHVALYEALDASMERANRDEFLIEKNKS